MRSNIPRHLLLLSCLAAAVPVGAQGTIDVTRQELEKDLRGATFEVRGPDNPLEEDVPFVVTVLAEAPSTAHRLEERTPDGRAAEGFTQLDVWNEAVHFHEGEKHLGSYACSLRKTAESSSGRSAVGVRQIGPVRFGLYGTPLGTSVAWQATMVLSGSGRYSIDAIPMLASTPTKLPLVVDVESHWPDSLTRALFVSIAVIAAGMLLVVPPRVLALLVLSLTIAGVARYAAPMVPPIKYLPVLAVALTVLCTVSWLKGRTLLNLMLGARESGAVGDERPRRKTVEREIRTPPVRKPAEPKVPQQETPETQAQNVVAQPPAPPEANAEEERPVRGLPAWIAKAIDWATAVARGIHAAIIRLRGPVKEEHVLAKQEESKRVTEVEPPSPVAPPSPPPAPEPRQLPDPAALTQYKKVADGIVAAAEHRAQWQLVVGGAAGLAAVLFLLTMSVTFGDAAIVAPSKGESMAPLVVRLLPYLLCFASLLLASAFLLRQYRSSLDDFRYFIRSQRLRESQVVAFEAARFLKDDDDVARKTIDILAWGEAFGSKARDATTGDSEAGAASRGGTD